MLYVLSSISIFHNDIVSLYSWEICPQIVVALQEMFWGTVNITQAMKRPTTAFSQWRKRNECHKYAVLH